MNIDAKIDEFFSQSKNILGNYFQDILFELDLPRNIERPSKLPLGHLMKIFNRLNVTLDSVATGAIDYQILADQVQGLGNLPSKYTDKMLYSSRFTGMYMLNYMAKTFGEKSAEITMQRFQLKGDQFREYDLRNNILLSIDLTSYVAKYHGLEAVEQMGENSVNVLPGTTAGKLLSETSSVHMMYERLVEEVLPKYVEKNYRWKIEKMMTHSIIVSGKPNKDIKDAFQSQIISEPMEMLRKGFLKAMPKTIMNCDVIVERLESIVNGAGRDLYQISFTNTSNRPFPKLELVQ